MAVMTGMTLSMLADVLMSLLLVVATDKLNMTTKTTGHDDSAASHYSKHVCEN